MDWEKLWRLIVYHQRTWTSLEITVIVSLMILCGIVCAVLIHKKKINWFQGVCAVALVFYLCAVLQCCVFTRSYTSEPMKLDLFWSWKIAAAGSISMLEQIILNIILYIPIGILIPLVFGKPVNPVWILLFGLGFSLLNESLQLWLNRGLFEVDDIMDNTIGAMIGALCSDLVVWIVKKIWRHFHGLKKHQVSHA